MYEQCCRKIQELENEKILINEGRLQVPKTYSNNHRHHANQYQKEALVIEQDGVITSPLSKTRD